MLRMKFTLARLLNNSFIREKRRKNENVSKATKLDIIKQCV